MEDFKMSLLTFSLKPRIISAGNQLSSIRDAVYQQQGRLIWSMFSRRDNHAFQTSKR